MVRSVARQGIKHENMPRVVFHPLALRPFLANQQCSHILSDDKKSLTMKWFLLFANNRVCYRKMKNDDTSRAWKTNPRVDGRNDMIPFGGNLLRANQDNRFFFCYPSGQCNRKRLLCWWLSLVRRSDTRKCLPRALRIFGLIPCKASRGAVKDGHGRAQLHTLIFINHLQSHDSAMITVSLPFSPRELYETTQRTPFPQPPPPTHAYKASSEEFHSNALDVQTYRVQNDVRTESG